MKNIFKSLLSGFNPWDLFALKLRTLSENKNSLKPYIPASISLLNLFFYSFIPILWIWVICSWIIKQNRIKEFINKSNTVSFWRIITWFKSVLKICLKSAFFVQTYLTIACIVSSFFLLRKIDYRKDRKGFIALSLENSLPALSLPSQNLSWQTLEHIVGKQKNSKNNLSNLSVFGASPDQNKLFLSVPEINFRKSEMVDKSSTVKNTPDHNTIDEIDVFRDSIWIHFSSNWNKEQQQIFIGLYPHKIHQKSKSKQQQTTNKATTTFYFKAPRILPFTATRDFSFKQKKQKTKHYQAKTSGFSRFKNPVAGSKKNPGGGGVEPFSGKPKLLLFKNLSHKRIKTKDKDKKVSTKKSIDKSLTLCESLSFSFGGKQVSNWSQIYARDWMGLVPEVKQNPQRNIFNGLDKVFQLKDWLQSWYSSLDEFPTKLSQNYKSVKRDNSLDLSDLVEILENDAKNDNKSISKISTFKPISINDLSSQKIDDKHTNLENDLSSQKIDDKHTNLENDLSSQKIDDKHTNLENDLSSQKIDDKRTNLENEKNKLENLFDFDSKQTRSNFYDRYYFLQNECYNLRFKNKLKLVLLPFFERVVSTKIKNSKAFGSQQKKTISLKAYKRIKKVRFIKKLFSELKPRAMSGYLYPDMERKQIEKVYLQSLYQKGFKPVSWLTDTNKSTNRKNSSKLGVGLPVKTKLPSSFLSEFTLKFGNFIAPKRIPTPKLHGVRKPSQLIVFMRKDPTEQIQKTEQTEQIQSPLMYKIFYDAYGIATDSITKDIESPKYKKISNLAFDFFSIENPLSNRKSDSKAKRLIKKLLLKNYLKNHLATLTAYRQNFDSTLTLLKQKRAIAQEYKDSDIFNPILSNELYQDVSKIKIESGNWTIPSLRIRRRGQRNKVKPSDLRKKGTTEHPEDYKIKTAKLLSRIKKRMKKRKMAWPLLTYQETKKIAYLEPETWRKFLQIHNPALKYFIQGASKAPLTKKLSSREVFVFFHVNRLLRKWLPALTVPKDPSHVILTKEEKEEIKIRLKERAKKDPAKEKLRRKIRKQNKRFFDHKRSLSNFVEWPLTSLDRQTFPWSFLDSQKNSHSTKVSHSVSDLFLESTGISSKILPKINIHYFPYLQTLSPFTPFEVTDLRNTSRLRRRKNKSFTYFLSTLFRFRGRKKKILNHFQRVLFRMRTKTWVYLHRLSLVQKKKKKKRFAYEPLTKYSWMVSFKVVCFVFLAKIALDHYDAYAKYSMYAFIELLRKTGVMSEEFIEESNLIPVPDRFRVIENLETRFRDVAGVDNLLPLLGRVVWFFRNKGRRTDTAGGRIPTGILLYGPPGTGKTFLVQAIAGEGEVPVLVQAGGTFYRFKKGKLFIKSRQIVNLFDKAKELAPCIIFLDELDSIAASRVKIMSNTETSLFEKEPNPHRLRISKTKQYRYSAADWEPEPATFLQKMMKPKGTVRRRRARKARERKDILNMYQKNLLGQLLIEMDGFTSRKEGVVVIGATNRPTILDEALLRFGRFSHIIHLELPRKQKRIEILKLYTKNLGIQESLSLDYFAELTTGWSASEIASAINESSMHAIIHDTVHTVETMERGIEVMSNSLVQTGKKWYGDFKDPFRVTRRAFYQAGKALVSSILVEHPRLVMLHLCPRPTNSRQNRRLSNALQIDKQTTRRPFEIRLIGFYAGKASELLVLGKNNLKQGKVSTRGLDKQKNAIFKIENNSLRKKYSNEIESVTPIAPISSVSNFYKAKRFVYLYKGLAYLKLNGEKKDLKSAQYLLSSKKNNQFGGTLKSTWNLKTNQKKNENNFQKMVMNSAINRMTLWHSDLGTDDLSAASSLASLMIEKWFFYSKTIASRSMIRVVTDHNEKSFPALRGYTFQRLEKMTELAAEDDDILSFKKYQSASIWQNQEWYPFFWWAKEARNSQNTIQTKQNINYIWFKIYIINPDPKALRNREWIPSEAFFHPNQALKNCLPNSINVDVPFNSLYNFDRDYIYHGLLLKSFHKAFLLLDKNRELLDYFADALIFSEILRENEIINIVSTFGYSVNQNKTLLTKPK